MKNFINTLFLTISGFLNFLGKCTQYNMNLNANIKYIFPQVKSLKYYTTVQNTKLFIHFELTSVILKIVRLTICQNLQFFSFKLQHVKFFDSMFLKFLIHDIFEFLFKIDYSISNSRHLLYHEFQN